MPSSLGNLTFWLSDSAGICAESVRASLELSFSVENLAPEVGLGPVSLLIRGQIITNPPQIKPIPPLLALILSCGLLTVLLTLPCCPSRSPAPLLCVFFSPAAGHRFGCPVKPVAIHRNFFYIHQRKILWTVWGRSSQRAQQATANEHRDVVWCKS